MSQRPSDFSTAGAYVSYIAQSSGTRPGFVGPVSVSSPNVVAVRVERPEWIEVDYNASPEESGCEKG